MGRIGDKKNAFMGLGIKRLGIKYTFFSPGK
jgi:hypothetical protein